MWLVEKDFNFFCLTRSVEKKPPHLSRGERIQSFITDVSLFIKYSFLLFSSAIKIQKVFFDNKGWSVMLIFFRENQRHWCYIWGRHKERLWNLIYILLGMRFFAITIEILSWFCQLYDWPHMVSKASEEESIHLSKCDKNHILNTVKEREQNTKGNTAMVFSLYERRRLRKFRSYWLSWRPPQNAVCASDIINRNVHR